MDTLTLLRAPRGMAPLLLVSVLALFAGRADAFSFSSIVVFGDSLSDTGNISRSIPLIPLPPYAPGRFSNGPVWVETLGANLGLPVNPSLAGGTNFAYGGAVTGLPAPAGTGPSLIDQLNTLYFPATGGFADPDALYVVFGGGNDVRAGLPAGAAPNIASIIADLTVAGATNFLVPNLPDIGQTPEAIAAGPAAQAQATAATVFHNAQLEAQVSTLRAVFPGVRITELDVFTIFNDILADPLSFGFAVTDAPCFTGATGVGGFGAVCSNPDEYLFWDGIHPTAATHEILGNLASAVVPVPAAMWLFGSALGLLGWVRRRTV